MASEWEGVEPMNLDVGPSIIDYSIPPYTKEGWEVPPLDYEHAVDPPIPPSQECSASLRDEANPGVGTSDWLSETLPAVSNIKQEVEPCEDDYPASPPPPLLQGFTTASHEEEGVYDHENPYTYPSLDDGLADVKQEIPSDNEDYHPQLTNDTGYDIPPPLGDNTLRPFEVTSNEGGQTQGLQCTCLTCGLQFSSIHEVEAHSVVHQSRISRAARNNVVTMEQYSAQSDEEKYQCTRCGERCPDKRSLYQHGLLHKKKKLHTCSFCGEGFKWFRHLQRHTYIHTGKTPYNCSVCGEGFWRKVPFNRHERSHKNPPKLHKCSECQMEFQTLQSLNTHLLLSHEKMVPTMPTLAKRKKRSTLAPRDQPFTCSVCGKGFTRESLYLVHIVTHSEHKPYMCTQCGEEFTTQNRLTRHAKTHSKEPYNCLYCPTLCNDSRALYSHMWQAHMCHKRYPCSLCGQVFAISKELRDHNKLHETETCSPCSKCNKKFTSSLDLEKHLDIHTGKTPHVCPVCGDGFSTLPELQIHHYSEKPKFTCSICGGMFYAEFLLDHHMSSHTGQDPHTCSLCEKRFKRKPERYRHFLKHHLICRKCDGCDKLFLSETHLNLHGTGRCNVRETALETESPHNHDKTASEKPVSPSLKESTQKEPDSCTLCIDGFTCMPDLKAHAVIHMDDPYTCEDCGMKFIHQYELQRHASLHTEENILDCSQCRNLVLTQQGLDKHALIHLHELQRHPFMQTEHKMVICPQCGKIFLTQEFLDNHALIHLDDKQSQSPQIKQEILACLECEKTFFTQEELDEHELRHNTARSCGHCNELFSSLEDIEKHVQESCPQTCGVCRKKLCSKEDLKKHLSLHTCEVCGQIYRTPSQLKAHKETHPGIRLYICSLCQKGFMTADGLRSHIVLDHKGQDVCSLAKTLDENEAQATEHGGSHSTRLHYPYCFVCSIRIPMLHILESHLQKKHTCHNDSICTICGRGYTKQGLVDHMQRDTTQPALNCTQCDKVFCLADDLEKHMDVHSGQTPHVCPICCDVFTSLSELKNHHLGKQVVPPFTCHVCGRRFWSDRTIKVHAWQRHRLELEVQTYRCILCRTESTLETAPTLYMCSTCHECCEEPKSVVTDIDVVETSCDVCVMGFDQITELQAHLDSHTC